MRYADLLRRIIEAAQERIVVEEAEGALIHLTHRNTAHKKGRGLRAAPFPVAWSDYSLTLSCTYGVTVREPLAFSVTVGPPTLTTLK